MLPPKVFEIKWRIWQLLEINVMLHRRRRRPQGCLESRFPLGLPISPPRGHGSRARTGASVSHPSARRGAAVERLKALATEREATGTVAALNVTRQMELNVLAAERPRALRKSILGAPTLFLVLLKVTEGSFLPFCTEGRAQEQACNESGDKKGSPTREGW